MNTPADQAHGIDRAHIAAALQQLGDDTPSWDDPMGRPAAWDAFGSDPEADR